MAKDKQKRQRLKKKLLHKYRLVILNEDTFEERISFKLTRLNVFVLVAFSAILLIVLTTFLIAFTSLREYIPGYSSTALKQKAINLNEKIDSLQQVVRRDSVYLHSIRNVLTGEIKSENINKDSLYKSFEIDPEDVNLAPSKQDSLLREEVAQEDKYNLFETATAKVNFKLFPPVKGDITQKYNSKEKHFAVDVVVPKDTPVKATADGMVIFSEWTAATGYVIIIEHPNNLISVYKHNASLTKQQGDLVTAGEVIARVGNTGELTTGPHLHFELWSEGYSIDPESFIDFTL
ncbi:murein DD-endopeptidase MepM/ murein hydrolase activator NlpD [Kordia periserrulae]|uniref:Murein DD-endopeptidase MepM/ murein hydrolase activator NlpD n=1 Tax=Kordia periserrulae TaxID=701523 RepID=A0A2T6BWJ9_9FLAO|nr:M23 family metallopeptidase [Kordia periserrulae]PTX60455.1 murein DD-endopeptidase MepM/ murein hydrolase activator NlpD [Kordia periserrulae]